MKKRVLLFTLILLFIPAVTMTAYAHPGRTDGNGGHTDQSTGDYHYHHGYPAHDHYDMDGDGDLDCPYEFDDQTNNGSNGSNNETWKPNNSTTNQSVNIPVYPFYQTTEENHDYTYNYIVILFTFVVLIFAMCIAKSNDDEPENSESNWIQGQILCIISILIVYGILFAVMIDTKGALEFQKLSLKKMFGAILSGCMYGGFVWFFSGLGSTLISFLLGKIIKKDVCDRLHAFFWLALPLAYLYMVSWHIFE